MSININVDIPKTSIAIVAILRDEEPFLDEWLIYHKLIGIDHFFLYDDAPTLPLKEFLKPHIDYVTIIPWYESHDHLPGRSRQTKAYWHAVQHFSSNVEWITFIDGDEFIVLKRWNNIKHFLSEFNEYHAISLNWHIFGHNGFYNDPPGLITAQLLRRMYKPNPNVKTIVKVASISSISSAHCCKLKEGSIRVDANKRMYTDTIYNGKTDGAHINHYQCRSFTRWMARVKRGDPTFDNTAPKEQKWRIDEHECLKQFVETVALNKNEFVDNYMLKYKDSLEKIIEMVKSIRNEDII